MQVTPGFPYIHNPGPWQSLCLVSEEPLGDLEQARQMEPRKQQNRNECQVVEGISLTFQIHF